MCVMDTESRTWAPAAALTRVRLRLPWDVSRWASHSLLIAEAGLSFCPLTLLLSGD